MVEVAESLLTEDFIVRVYEFLAVAKVKGLLGEPMLAEGQIDGYLQCLEDLFGRSSEEQVEKNADEGRTILGVLDRMIGYMSAAIDPFIKVNNGVPARINDLDTWLRLTEVVEDNVRSYAIDNFDDCVQGIRSL
jgi:hypothetical protein